MSNMLLTLKLVHSILGPCTSGFCHQLLNYEVDSKSQVKIDFLVGFLFKSNSKACEFIHNSSFFLLFFLSLSFLTFVCGSVGVEKRK